tara:strand:+ start:2132 stop:3136 length:1005 start_codon:yes stop_codon:yes gene_type:complete
MPKGEGFFMNLVYPSGVDHSGRTMVFTIQNKKTRKKVVINGPGSEITVSSSTISITVVSDTVSDELGSTTVLGDLENSPCIYGFDLIDAGGVLINRFQGEVEWISYLGPFDGSTGSISETVTVNTEPLQVIISGDAIVGSGDMLASVYDPTGVQGDAFDMSNMVEGTNALILTQAERNKINVRPYVYTYEITVSDFTNSGGSAATIEVNDHAFVMTANTAMTFRRAEIDIPQWDISSQGNPEFKVLAGADPGTELGTVTGFSSAVPQAYDGADPEPAFYTGSSSNVSASVTAGDGIVLKCTDNGHALSGESGYGGFESVTDFIRVRLYFDLADF